MNDHQPIHVLSVLNFDENQLARLGAVSPRLEVRQVTCKNGDETSAALNSQTEVLYGSWSPRDMAVAPKLRWVQLHNAGTTHLVGTQLWQSEVTITTASGIHVATMSEYVIGMMIALGRHFARHAGNQQRSTWPGSAEWRDLLGTPLRDCALLLIGYGSVGRETARIAQAMGMRIRAVKRSPDNRRDEGYTLPGTGDREGRIPERFYGSDQLLEALPWADYVACAAPGTKDTLGMIGAPELAAMRNSAYLLNVGRGGIIDEGALLRALEAGEIAGAALDVYSEEPHPADSSLWKAPKLIMTPHNSGATTHYNDYAVELFETNLRKYVEGQPLFNVLSRDLGY